MPAQFYIARFILGVADSFGIAVGDAERIRDIARRLPARQALPDREALAEAMLWAEFETTRRGVATQES